MINYHELANLPVYSVEDIIQRVRFTNAGPEILMKGEIFWGGTYSEDRYQTLAESLPHLISFIQSPHAAEKLAACNKTDSHADRARLRLYFDDIKNTQIPLMCQMLQNTQFSIPTIIVFGDNQLKDEEVQQLAKVFQHCSPFLWLDLWDVNITDVGVLHIRDALMKAPIQKGFRLVIKSVDRAKPPLLLQIQDALINAINLQLENNTPNLQEICEALNGYQALHQLWPGIEFDTVKAKTFVVSTILSK